MTIDKQIFTYVLRAKCVAACRAENLINRKNAGEDTRCCELKLILLAKWVEILENYYCLNYGDGGKITPGFAGLTLDEAQGLLAKLKILIK